MIYVIRSDHAPIVKIGYTERGDLRLKSLAHQERCSFTILAYINGRMQDESKLHKRFRDMRLHGEWFAEEGALERFIARAAAVSDRADVGLRFSCLAAGTGTGAHSKACKMWRNGQRLAGAATHGKDLDPPHAGPVRGAARGGDAAGRQDRGSRRRQRHPAGIGREMDDGFKDQGEGVVSRLLHLP